MGIYEHGYTTVQKAVCAACRVAEHIGAQHPGMRTPAHPLLSMVITEAGALLNAKRHAASFAQ